MIHPSFMGNTLSGDNTKENVARYLAGGLILNSEGWFEGPTCNIAPVEPEASTQAKIKPIGSILHSNAAPRYTKAIALLLYWRRKDVNGEAHFQVDDSGIGTQAIPIFRKADCNAKGNFFYKNGQPRGYISYETSDFGGATLSTTPWSLGQLEFMIATNFLMCAAEGTACSQCPTPYSSGIDYHSKFPEWSIYKGKTCPGAARIRQMDYVRTEVAKRLAEYFSQCGGSCP